MLPTIVFGAALFLSVYFILDSTVVWNGKSHTIPEIGRNSGLLLLAVGCWMWLYWLSH